MTVVNWNPGQSSQTASQGSSSVVNWQPTQSKTVATPSIKTVPMPVGGFKVGQTIATPSATTKPVAKVQDYSKPISLPSGLKLNLVPPTKVATPKTTTLQNAGVPTINNFNSTQKVLTPEQKIKIAPPTPVAAQPVLKKATQDIKNFLLEQLDSFGNNKDEFKNFVTVPRAEWIKMDTRQKIGALANDFMASNMVTAGGMTAVKGFSKIAAILGGTISSVMYYLNDPKHNVKNAILHPENLVFAIIGGKLGAGEKTPEEVINHVLDNELEKTSEGETLIKIATEAQKSGKNIKIEKPYEESVVQYVNQETGVKEYKTIKTGELNQFKQAIDNSGGMVLQDDEGNNIYLTVKSPEQMEAQGFKNTGEANVKELPNIKPSKIGISIEAKAVEAKLTKGFEKTAGYEPIKIKEQAKMASDLINKDIETARAIVRGEQELPKDLKGTALITAMEEHIKKNPNSDLSYELANSPLVTGTSQAAQELRLAAEREPDSATAKLTELKKAREDQVKNLAEKQSTIKEQIKTETKKMNLKKEDLSWNKFIDSIAC